MSIEHQFDTGLVAAMALKEKQIQQNYRPIIAVHKWFARRPGTLFRGLILSEFGDRSPRASSRQTTSLAEWSQTPLWAVAHRCLKPTESVVTSKVLTSIPWPRGSFAKRLNA